MSCEHDDYQANILQECVDCEADCSFTVTHSPTKCDPTFALVLLRLLL